MWQIGHRGYSDKYGDNNMESFRKAAEAGFDMIELDIQLCNTGGIVVFHDTWFSDKYILDMSYKDLAVHKMVLLEDVFREFAHTKMRLFLDIKGTDDIVHPLVQLLNTWFSSDDMDRIYVSGFTRGFVTDLLQYKLPIHVGFTTGNRFTLEQLDLLCKDMSYVCIHWTALDAAAIEYLHNKGMLVFSYTCEDAFSLNHMMNYRIDGIVTNSFLTISPPPTPKKARSSIHAAKELANIESLSSFEFST